MFNACDQLRLSLEIMLNEKYIRYRNQKDWQNSFYVYEPKSFLITQTPSGPSHDAIAIIASYGNFGKTHFRTPFLNGGMANAQIRQKLSSSDLTSFAFFLQALDVVNVDRS